MLGTFVDTAISAEHGLASEADVFMTVDDPIAVLKGAVGMEFQGKEFFEDAAGKVGHPRTKIVFESLAKQEQKHIDVLAEELRRLQGGQSWASLTEAQVSAKAGLTLSVFQEERMKHLVLDPNAGELEALKLGIEVEQRSIEYYRNAGARVSDPHAKEVFNWLVGQEAGHLTILSSEYEYRSNPGFYYDTMEFSLEVM